MHITQHFADKLGVSLLTLLLLPLVLIVVPHQFTVIRAVTSTLTSTSHGAALHFSIQADPSLLPNNCVLAHWETAQIATIALNDTPTVGVGSKRICQTNRVTWEVQFRNGSSQDYRLSTAHVSYSPQAFGRSAVIIGLCALGLAAAGWLDARGRLAIVTALAVIVSLGVVLRLWLALTTSGNFDLESYNIVTNILRSGGNVYAETLRYNYSPVWFHILGLLDRYTGDAVSLGASVRLMLTAVDLLLLALALALAAREGRSLVRTAAYFFLNPVSILITGYHGQFENLALLLVVFGIWWAGQQPHTRLGRLWLTATLAVLVKQNLLWALAPAIAWGTKRWGVRLCLFILSGGIFLATLLPYATTEAARTNIMNAVLLYSGTERAWGINVFINRGDLVRTLFIVALLAYGFLLSHADLVRRQLLCCLFFLTFSTGYGIQWLAMPLVLGALRPGRGFFVYSLVAGLMILGQALNLKVPELSLLAPGIAWLAVLYWFISEQFDVWVSVRLKKPVQDTMLA